MSRGGRVNVAEWRSIAVVSPFSPSCSSSSSLLLEIKRVMYRHLRSYPLCTDRSTPICLACKIKIPFVPSLHLLNCDMIATSLLKFSIPRLSELLDSLFSWYSVFSDDNDKCTDHDCRAASNSENFLSSLAVVCTFSELIIKALDQPSQTYLSLSNHQPPIFVVSRC